jgi:hypothetical protein
MENIDDGWEEISEALEGDGDSGNYVTKDELREMLSELLGGGGSDDDDGWELLDDLTEGIGGGVSAADIERIAEQKVQAAIAKLTGAKKPTTRRPATPTAKPKKEPEIEPTVKKRSRFGQSFWGGE